MSSPVLSFLRSLFTAVYQYAIRFVQLPSPPRHVEICPGPSKAVSFRILKAVLRHVDLDFVHYVPYTNADDSSTPVPWIKLADDVEEEIGLMSICRYLGHRAQLHAANAEDALVVDAALERLHECIAGFDGAECERSGHTVLQEALMHLEERLLHQPWLALDRLCLADVCWFGAIEWWGDNDSLPTEKEFADTYPNVVAWLSQMHDAI